MTMPLASVAAGFVTIDEIASAVDAAFDEFYALNAYAGPINPPVYFTDDYVEWVWPNNVWAGGDTNGHTYVRSCLWSRGQSDSDPGDVWIKRAPHEFAACGTDYPVWRFTARPLAPAIYHELHDMANPGTDKATPINSSVLVMEATSP